jgi:hypothetical protein
MRKWFDERDDDSGIPCEAPRNWPIHGPRRADTLQKGQGQGDNVFHFTNQSDDIPQPLNLLRCPPYDHHPLFNIRDGNVLEKYPDHMHEGETLGYGGVEGSEPWTLDEELTFKGVKFTEYPTKNGNKERPIVIATGSVIGGHTTLVEPNKFCESGFAPDPEETVAKAINTISVYDGYKVGVGRVLTDSSIHHFLDLNLIGDPCATEEKMYGLERKFLGDMSAFYVNCAKWLAPRWGQEIVTDRRK